MPITFDQANLVINVTSPTTEIDVQLDLYSAWKEWVIANNACCPPAFTAIGGQQITATQYVGITYFLENGWRIEPWAGTYLLSINGNIYTREAGENPIVPVGGVTVSLNRSNLVDIVLTSGGATISNTDLVNIANTVWEEVVNTGKGTTAREKLDKVATKTQDIALS